MNVYFDYFAPSSLCIRVFCKEPNGILNVEGNITIVWVYQYTFPINCSMVGTMGTVGIGDEQGPFEKLGNQILIIGYRDQITIAWGRGPALNKRQALGMEYSIISASEMCAEYRQFCEVNHPGRIKHFFKSIEDQVARGATCATCSGSFMQSDIIDCDPLSDMAGQDVDLMVTGSPCDPFSTQRAKRFADGGVQTHFQFDVTMKVVIDLYATYQPTRGIFEQVEGFCKPFVSGGVETPKDRCPGLSAHQCSLL